LKPERRGVTTLYLHRSPGLHAEAPPVFSEQRRSSRRGIGIEGFGAGYQFKMTTMADMLAKAKSHVAALSSWTAYAGGLALSLLLAAIVAMPVGQVILDYWQPRMQAMWQAPPPAIKQPVKGKL
jgi:hypothetical protein